MEERVAEIRPFRGLRYNQSLISDLSKVICPPYDIISLQQQQELHQRSEYNFVRLEYARELPRDNATDNKYTRSAEIMEQWLSSSILQAEETPAIYLHDHYFTLQGKEYRRRGIIACVRLEDWDKKVIRPHEGILTRARDDRLSLLSVLQANTSPVLAMFQDQTQQLSSLLTAQEQNEPLISLSDSDGESHHVWAITQPEILSQITVIFADKPVYIADGHHRYTSALTYRNQRSAISPLLSGDEPFNYVMMTLVDFADPGLIILAPHRLVRGIPGSVLGGLITRLAEFFEISELPLSAPGVWQRVDEFQAATDEVRLVLFGPTMDCLFLLRPRDVSAISQTMPYFHTELYRKLDVAVIDHVILGELLELSVDGEEERVAFGYDRQDAVSRVLDREYQLAFFLRPVKPELIKAVADNGERMPRKSTYFYPKTPSGLVFHRFV